MSSRIMRYMIVINLIMVSVVNATIINVPADQSTIQAGIDASVDGDTVLVQPGTYVENINFNGHNIVLGSLFLTTQDTSYISSTIIDGNQSGSVVTFNNGEGLSTQLMGLSVTNGRVLGTIWSGGGGVLCSGASPHISYCKIFNNTTESYNWTSGGAGVKCLNSSPIIANTIISNNTLIGGRGGGLYVSHGSPIILSSTIVNNSGSGIYFYSEVNNHKPIVINSILWGNEITSITLGLPESLAVVAVQFSCVYDYGSNDSNISQNPEFVDSEGKNYRLSDFSPCIGAGIDSIYIDDIWYYAPTTDIDGNPRPIPSGSNPDMGAFENPLAEPIQFIGSVFPAQNALNVRQDTDISVSFGADIDMATINSNTFVVHASQTGLHTGTYSYNPGVKTATFTPASPFKVGERIEVTLTSGMYTISGHSIQPFNWTFTAETEGGSGTFTNKTDYGTGSDPACVVSSDLDGDGDIDLAVVSWASDIISIFKNYGDGTFAAKVDYNTGNHPKSAISSDLDGDGDMDLAVVNQGSSTVSILMNNGDGTFASRNDFNVVYWPKSIASSDLDLDGDMDLASIGNQSVLILLNDGGGFFVSGDSISTSADFTSIAISDLDGDGDGDLALPIYNSNTISIMMNNGDGTFASMVSYDTGNSPSSIAISDFDGDANEDLAVANSYVGTVSILMNNGDGTFATKVDYFIGGSDSLSIVSSDLDGDRDMDLVVANVNSPIISILLNEGDGIFAETVDYTLGVEPWSVSSSDLDGDGDIDLATANWGQQTLSILFNEDVYGVNITITDMLEYSGEISLDYSVLDPDSMNTSLYCEYSMYNMTNWFPATIVGDTADLTFEDWDGTIIWDSFIDLPGLDIPDAVFKITPYNSTNTGRSDISRAFHIDNNQTPSVEITPVSDEQRLEINVYYQLSDIEDDTLGILCEYYDESSETWRTATLSDDTSAVTNYSGQLTWNSQSDRPVAYNEQLFRITPYDKDLGTSDTVAIFIDQLGISVAEQISQYTSEQTDDVIVNFTLSDDEDDAIDILLEYSIDSGNNWSPATVTGITTELLPDQYDSSIIWNSLDDLPGIDKVTVRLKLTPNDGSIGFPIETNDFHLDNNQSPMISTISCPDSIVVVAELSYSLTDSEHDTLSLSIEYSSDEGQTWNVGVSGGTLSTIIPDNYNETFDWYTFESLGFQRLHNVWLKFKVSDNDPGTDTTLKNISVVNYPAEYTGDLIIDTDDLAIFASAWNADPQDVLYEIGPAIGMVPELTPQQDGLLDFEDLGVFVQMWNWSYEHNGLTKPIVLSKSFSDTPAKISFDISKPEDRWSSDGKTSINIETKQNDLMQVELILERIGQDISINVSEGDYFDARYQVSPLLTNISADSTISLFCLTGLGESGSQTMGDIIAEINISNRSDVTQLVVLFYRVWDESANVVESGQINLDIESFLPDEFSLKQNFPNPFNPNTTIRYTLPRPADVTLSIFNIRGELVNTLVSKIEEGGYHQVIWNGATIHGKLVSAGVYFYRISTSEFTDTKKMVLLK